MKKLIFLLSFTAATACCFAQETDITKPLSKNDYLQKSKNQKTAAWVMLGVGAALDVAGIATTLSNASKELDYTFGFGQPQTSVNHAGEYVLYIAGTAALGASLALFIAAKRNKTRAASLTFKNEMTPQLQNSTVHYSPLPSLSLKIKL